MVTISLLRFEPVDLACAHQLCDQCYDSRPDGRLLEPALDLCDYVTPALRVAGLVGRAGKAELLIGLEGVSSRPVPRGLLVELQPDATSLSLASEAQYIRSEIGYLVPA